MPLEALQHFGTKAEPLKDIYDPGTGERKVVW